MYRNDLFSSKFVLLLTCCYLCAVSCRAEENAYAISFSQFAADLYSKCAAKTDGNIVISPYSVASALALLMQGADGKTLEQMEKAMHLSGDKTIIANQFAEYFNTSCEINRNKSLFSANRLYIQNGYQIRQKFADTIVNRFNSDVINIDFAKSTESACMINAFVQNKTNNRIMDIIKADSLNGNTRLVGVNAIYFKDNWNIAFQKERTFKGDFYSEPTKVVPVEFMRSLDDFLYANHQALDARVIGLKFNNSDLMFLIVLPNALDGLSVLEMKLRNYDLKDITKIMHKTEVDVTLPKFKIDFELDLNDILKELGMTDMFADTANFSDLLMSSEPLHVSNVVHKASIEVNEDGAEAAAATGTQVVLLSLPRYTDFNANHAFVYFIANKKTNAVIFSGRFKPN